MGRALITNSYLQAIASAIRTKLQSQNTYTPSQMAPAILSIPPRSEPVLGTKVITYNGVFNASDDNLDGYSEVTVSRNPSLHPMAYDATNGYVNGSTFTIGSGYYSDIYEVESGHTYRIETGSSYGTLFRVLFTTTDTSTATSVVSGTSVASASASSSSLATYTATSNGYITFTKGSVSGKSSCVFDVTLAEDL